MSTMSTMKRRGEMITDEDRRLTKVLRETSRMLAAAKKLHEAGHPIRAEEIVEDVYGILATHLDARGCFDRRQG